MAEISRELFQMHVLSRNFCVSFLLRCSNDIFILDLTPGFNRLGKDNCKTDRETAKCWALVCLVLEILMVLI